ncbi:Orexin receptor type 1 [Trichoplax sp. H2]|nr:Orexin receptor type 1 [Trichoplax sp. H2]|eukprot:RDD38914.1 Orexin receptor type 1 [Trichoplax sp. H2]
MATLGWVKEAFQSARTDNLINSSNYSIINNVTKSRNNLAYMLPFSILTTIVNGLVCYAIRKRGLLRLSIYSFIFNMCISDILAPVAITINSFIINEIQLQNKLLYEISCKFFNYVLTVSMAVSMISFTIMAVDRFYITVLRKRRRLLFSSKRSVRLTIFCIWLHGIITSIPVLQIMAMVYEPNRACDIIYVGDYYNIPFFTFFLIINYFIPVLITAILYIFIVIRLKIAVMASLPYGRTIPPVIYVNKRKAINTIKMIATTTVFYVLTSFPYVVIMLILSDAKVSMIELRRKGPVYSLLITLGFLMSALSCIENAIVCVVMSKELRKTIINSLRTLLGRKTVHYRIHVKQK